MRRPESKSTNNTRQGKQTRNRPIISVSHEKRFNREFDCDFCYTNLHIQPRAHALPSANSYILTLRPHPALPTVGKISQPRSRRKEIILQKGKMEDVDAKAIAGMAMPRRPINFVPAKAGDILKLGHIVCRVMEDGSRTGGYCFFHPFLHFRFWSYRAVSMILEG